MMYQTAYPQYTRQYNPMTGEDQVPAMGVMAGRIWHILNNNGPMSISALVRRIQAPRDYVMEGIGWLAREGKIQVVEESRVRIVSLFPEQSIL